MYVTDSSYIVLTVSGTADIQCSAHYIDYFAGASPFPRQQNTDQFVEYIAAMIVAPPAEGRSRAVKQLIIRNRSTTTASITIQHVNSDTKAEIYDAELPANASLQYTDERGWSIVHQPAIRKILGQSNPSATTLTTAYAVPSGRTASVKSITVCNRSAVATAFRIAVRPLLASIGNEHYIYYDVAIPGNDTFASSLDLTLASDDLVVVYATLATLSFGVFGKEYP
jgi:hypothetical protein